MSTTVQVVLELVSTTAHAFTPIVPLVVVASKPVGTINWLIPATKLPIDIVFCSLPITSTVTSVKAFSSPIKDSASTPVTNTLASALIVSVPIVQFNCSPVTGTSIEGVNTASAPIAISVPTD